MALRNRELSKHVDQLTRQLASSQVLTQLAAGAMHDLRNVLHVALSVAERLEESGQRPEDRALVRAMLDSLGHGHALTQDLLALARDSQSAGQVTDCRELVPSLERLMSQIDPRRLQCRVEVEGDVGSIMVSPGELNAALLNLCINARDAMPHGGELRLRIRTLPARSRLPEGLAPGEYVEFAVIDTGHGMSAEVRERATQPFFTTKDKSGGTGMGLAMVQAFAARFGGRLSIESEPGVGSCVSVWLPKVQPAGAHRRAPADAAVAQVAEQIRNDDLRQALAIWRDLREPGKLPRPLELGARLAKYSDRTITLRVEDDASGGALRLQRIGSVLESAADNRAFGPVPLHGSVTPGTLAAAYRRALQSGQPSHEWVDYAVSVDADRESESLERLILPAATTGERVSHLIGVIQLPRVLDPGQTPADPPEAGRVARAGDFALRAAAPLRNQLERMREDELDELPFGVIKLDPSGRVTYLSRTEAQQSGYGDREAVNLDFFTEVAPCMARPEIVASAEEARRTGSLDITFEQVGDFDDPERELLVRMVSASDGGTWVCLRRSM